MENHNYQFQLELLEVLVSSKQSLTQPHSTEIYSVVFQNWGLILEIFAFPKSNIYTSFQKKIEFLFYRKIWKTLGRESEEFCASDTGVLSANIS